MGRGRRAAEKPQDFSGVMKKLMHFCRRYIPAIIVALVLGAIGTVCQIVGPDKLKDMTNEIAKGLPALVNGKPVLGAIDMDAVTHIAWLLVALYVGYAVLCYVQSWMMANVTQRTAQELREAISVKINKLPLKYFDKVSYGDVLSRITNDVDAIGQTLGQSVGSLITSVTLFVGALIMMFYNNVIMTVCAIVSSLVGLLIMGVIMKVSQKYSRASRSRWVMSTVTSKRCMPDTPWSRRIAARLIRFARSKSTTTICTIRVGKASSFPA